MSDALDDLLAVEGWPYASSTSTGEGDPGRFHALFGRDSLICSLQVLPSRPDVARATLRALAARQGTRVHAGTLEEPGKIGHEFRDAPPAASDLGEWPDPGPFDYFATADATSWWLVVLAALGDAGVAEELAAPRSRAVGWLLGALDAGGGLVRHGIPDPGWPGLTQHGWRDTVVGTNGAGIARPDGTLPPAPLADADTQAVAYAALVAAAALADAAPADAAAAPHLDASDLRARAAELRARLSVEFTPDVMAIDGEGAPVPGAGSQLGWLLWADALEPDAAAAAAERLCAPDVLTAYGLRTLSGDAPAFDAHAYHRGSVWPFDSWLGWGGLRAAGRRDEAERVRRGVLAALDDLGQAPELYAVERDGRVAPVATANRVQAWTVGARMAFEHGWDGRATR